MVRRFPELRIATERRVAHCTLLQSRPWRSGGTLHIAHCYKAAQSPSQQFGRDATEHFCSDCVRLQQYVILCAIARCLREAVA